jgi:hypothetical protein
MEEVRPGISWKPAICGAVRPCGFSRTRLGMTAVRTNGLKSVDYIVASTAGANSCGRCVKIRKNLANPLRVFAADGISK